MYLVYVYSSLFTLYAQIPLIGGLKTPTFSRQNVIATTPILKLLEDPKFKSLMNEMPVRDDTTLPTPMILK
jgi:hypothetical protein